MKNQSPANDLSPEQHEKLAAEAGARAETWEADSRRALRAADEAGAMHATAQAKHFRKKQSEHLAAAALLRRKGAA
jgi:hypothetical protein